MQRKDAMSETVDVRVAANGRLVLPKTVREAMGLDGETVVTLVMEEGGVRLIPLSERIAEAQALYRATARRDRTVDDFLRERREEADREEAEAEAARAAVEPT